MKTIWKRAQEYADRFKGVSNLNLTHIRAAYKFGVMEEKIALLDKTCTEFRNFLEKRVDNPHYQLNRSDFDNWVNDFRKAFEE